MYRLLRPLLFRLDPERVHHLALGAGRAGQAVAAGALARAFAFEDARLAQTVFGRAFENPVGLAAGMDKDARLVPLWEALGFGFTEVGSVTARPSAGNARPRLFRLPGDGALVNRLGLNNEGADAVAARLARLNAGGGARRVLGVNVAKTHDPSILGANAVADFAASFRRLAPHAGYVALNVSCPNTREGKTFEEPAALDSLLAAVMAERAAMASAVPVLVKLSPPRAATGRLDSFYAEAVAIARARGVAGFIATNTAPDRDGLGASPARLAAIGAGGLSGAPLAARSLHLVRELHRLTGGALPIVGVGGVGSAESAYARLRAGASLVELYTALVYAGPGLVRSIKRGLVRLLERDGLAHVSEAVGQDA